MQGNGAHRYSTLAALFLQGGKKCVEIKATSKAFSFLQLGSGFSFEGIIDPSLDVIEKITGGGGSWVKIRGQSENKKEFEEGENERCMS